MYIYLKCVMKNIMYEVQEILKIDYFNIRNEKVNLPRINYL